MQIYFFISFAKPVARWFWIICWEFWIKIGAITANNLFLTVVLSDFNIKCKTSSYEGSKIDAVIDAVWITTSN